MDDEDYRQHRKLNDIRDPYRRGAHPTLHGWLPGLTDAGALQALSAFLAARPGTPHPPPPPPPPRRGA